jgi:tetratricopeptide (TPR) repeat protein
MLNLATLADSGFEVDNKETIRQRLKAAAENPESRLHFWELAGHYGYVRAPAAYAETGWVWALSGNPSLSAASFNKLVDLSGDRAFSAKRFLAELQIEYGENAKAEELYRNVVESNPGDGAALLGLARAAAIRGKITEMESFLARARDAGVRESLIHTERALGLWHNGDLAEARAILERRATLETATGRELAILTSLLIELRDKKALSALSASIKRGDTRDIAALLALAQVESVIGDTSEARRLYRRVLKFRPASVWILEKMLQLDILERRRASASRLVAEILQIAPGNASANYVLGTFHLEDGDFDLAESSLRRSLAAHKTSYGLNDLAWVLHRLERNDEALTYAQESLASDSSSSHTLDTLGAIYLALGKLEKAREALHKAIELQHDNPNILLHLAELYERLDDRQRALELVETTIAQPGLSDDMSARLRAMQRRLSR